MLTMEDSGSTFRHLPFLLASKQHSLINGKRVFFLHFSTVPCFPLLAILCFPACALDISLRFSCAVYQVFSRFTAVSCFPLLARVGTEFMFSCSSHTFHVSRAWQQLQVFPRVSTSSPTLAADSCLPPPPLASLFLLSSLAHLSITQPSFVFSRNAAALTARQKERSIVVTRQVTAF